MRSLSVIFLCYCMFLFSCTKKQAKPIIPINKILYNQDSFWEYYYNSVNLSDDFVAYDENNVLIDRAGFFNKLENGFFIPVSLETKDSVKHYKLYELSTAIEPEFRNNILSIFKQDIKFFKMEGMMLPKFNFTDLKGDVYNANNTKGKILVLKFWFIGCGACVEEMPSLNKMVTKYKNRPDIKFLSLATDTKAKLQKFLSKTKFSYSTAPVSEEYVSEANVEVFPTHMIIKEGKIERVISTEKQLNEVLARLSSYK